MEGHRINFWDPNGVLVTCQATRRGRRLTHIWKCGKLVAGRTQPSSSNLAVSSCTMRHWGCPVEWRPLLEFVTHCELRPDSTLMWSLGDRERKRE